MENKGKICIKTLKGESYFFFFLAPAIRGKIILIFLNGSSSSEELSPVEKVKSPIRNLILNKHL